MSLTGQRIFGVLAGLLSLLCGPAVAQPIDEWHYIDAESVLHTEHVAGLYGVGVIQSDQIFALLVRAFIVI